MKENIKKYITGSAEEPDKAEETVATVVQEAKKLETQVQHEISSSNKQEDPVSFFESIFSSLVEDEWVEESLQNYTTPTYTLREPASGKYHWLVDYTTKMVAPVNHASEVVPLQDLDDDMFLCQIGDTHYIITGSIIQHVGYN